MNTDLEFRDGKWRVKRREPSVPSRESVPVPYLRVGDVFMWCGRAVRVLACELSVPPKYVSHRRAHHSGRWFTIEIPGHDTLRVHYYDEESVPLSPSEKGDQ